MARANWLDSPVKCGYIGARTKLTDHHIAWETRFLSERSQQQNLIVPRRLKGFLDHGAETMGARERILTIARRTAELAQFDPMDTPCLEYIETLIGQGGDTDKEVYRFRDHGDRDVGLRFDLTMPFARFIAERHGQLTFPFKRFQTGKVWRGENTQDGRYREFTQIDFDIVGVDSTAADTEVIQAIARVLREVGFGPFTLRVGHRRLVSGLVTHFCGTVTPEAETKILITLDKLEKIGPQSVAKLLTESCGVEPAGAASLLAVLTAKDALGDTDLSQFTSLGEDFATARGRIAETMGHLRAQNVAAFLDLSIVRGLAYYTGIVFETKIDALPAFGSVASGGRYDNLISRFTAQSLSGVGGSIGLDRLVAAIAKLAEADARAAGQRLSVPAVFVAVATPDARSYAFQVLGELRDRGGLSADIALTEGKVAKQFRHADRRGYDLAVVVGTDEREKNEVTLKDMVSGTEQKNVPLAGLAAAIQNVRARRSTASQVKVQ